MHTIGSEEDLTLRKTLPPVSSLPPPGGLPRLWLANGRGYSSQVAEVMELVASEVIAQLWHDVRGIACFAYLTDTLLKNSNRLSVGGTVYDGYN